MSSAGVDLGCFLTHDTATAKLQDTGQERLLQVIGTTARLEERQVIEVLTPSSTDYRSTPPTCPDPTAPGCSFDALKNKTVVFYGADVAPGQPSTTKYKMGRVEVPGEAIKKATAVYNSGGQTSLPTGWQIDFQLTSQWSKTFGAVTSAW